MPHEEDIKQGLIQRFSFLDGAIAIPRPRRISFTVDYAHFFEVFEFCVKQLSCVHLCTITGLDEGQFLSFIYHLATDTGILLNIKTSIPKSNPVLQTVTAYFPGAQIYEREIIDLLGAKVEGLPPGNRYPLTDDWPVDEHPLLKDWKPSWEQEKGVTDDA